MKRLSQEDANISLSLLLKDLDKRIFDFSDAVNAILLADVNKYGHPIS